MTLGAGSIFRYGQAPVFRDAITAIGGSAFQPRGDIIYQLGPFQILQNPDPILRDISYSDIAEYKRMERGETAISNAKQHFLAAVFGPGFKVVVGDSRSERAYKIRDLCAATLEAIPNWGEVEQRMMDARWWGYQPFNLLWTSGFRIGNSNYYTVSEIRDEDSENYVFSPSWDLIYRGDFRNPEPQLMSAQDQSPYWMVARSGSTRTAYGRGRYMDLWLLAYIKSRFLQMFAQGTERSMGMLYVKESGTAAPGRDTGIDKPGMDQLIAEVNQILTVLAENNVLITRPGLAVEFLKDLQFADGWLHSLEYLDQKLAQGIIGQNLTMQVDSKGSRAAIAGHEGVLENFAALGAKMVSSAIRNQLFKRIILPNFGPVPNEDIPSIHYYVTGELNLEAARALFDMGVPIDARPIGERFGVSVLTDEEKSKPGVVVAQKAEPTKLQSGPTPFLPVDQRNQMVGVADRMQTTARDAAQVAARDAFREFYFSRLTETETE